MLHMRFFEGFTILVLAIFTPQLRAQVIDSPAGSVQMTPGAVGKGDTLDIASHDAAATGKSAYLPPSEEEQLSRQLLALKDQRAALASKLGAADPQVRDLDAHLTDLRQNLAQRSIANGAVANSSGDVPQTVIMFPRIVPDEPAPEASLASSKAAAPVSTASQEPASEAQARHVLQQAMVSFNAEAQGLEKVLDLLRDQTHANIYINWTALQTANVDRSTPITLNLQQVDAGRALRTILAVAGGANANLAYTIDDGIVTISTKEDLTSTKYQQVRVYDVRDLLSVSNAYPAQFAMAMYTQQVENLMDTVRTTVAPDTWRDSGGTVGTIRELNGQLIINQTADNHRAIELLLAQLRQR